jgi:ankyrin repeat protein
MLRALHIGVLVLGAAGLPAVTAVAPPAAESGAHPFAGPPEALVADAAMRRDTARIRRLLKQGADVNAAQSDGMTALHWSARSGTADEVKMLLLAGARTEAVTRNGAYTPLHLASRLGNVAALRALLGAGANPHAVTTTGRATALHLAAQHGSADVVSALLEAGVKVDVREGAWDQTPLMWAAAYNRIDAARVLVAKGASLRATSKVEDVPARERADRAALALRTRRVAALKSAEQPPRVPGTPARDSSTAARRPSAADSVARPQTPARDSAARQARTPADSAATRPAGQPRAGEPTLTPEQRAAAADSARIRDSQGRALGYGDLVGNKGGLTPLLFAVRQGYVEMAKLLLDAGADIGQVSAGDHTSPLLMATINGHFDLGKLLLERGASPNQASDAGATPLYATINVQWAAKSLYPQPTAQRQQKTSYLALMADLLQAGADVNARLTKHLWYMSYNFDLLGVNTVGATPFWRAAYGLDLDAMKLLIAHGADPKIPTTKPFSRIVSEDAPTENDSTRGQDPSGLPPIPNGGPGVYPIHAASGVGYGEGFAANSHVHAPDAWIPAVKYLVEVLGADVNARDHNGFSPMHHAAARGDNALIEYLVSKGGDVKVVSRRGQTTADMANGPVQRIPPFPETVALLEKLGAKNNNKCRSC